MKVCLDSRLIQKGDYFVPIKGDSFDGHDYIDQALSNGAEGIIEENDLYKLAQDKLSKVKPIIIGVAGSVGKSTFRTYLVQILSTKFKVLDGSLNTKLGLATNIINDLSDHEIFVAELGIDRLGEMKIVTDFLKPDFSVITKLEKEHLQFLLSLENVVKENLVAITNSKEKFGYVNKSDKNLVSINLSSDITICYFKEGHSELISESLSLYPSHDLTYFNCIYQIAKEKFGFSGDEFKKALKNIKKPKGRLNIIEGKNDSVIIDDSYNAVADASVIEGIKFALATLSSLRRQRSKDEELTIILSTMRETGESEAEQHKRVAEYLNTLDYKELYIVGDDKNLYCQWINNKYKSVNSYLDINIEPTSKDLFYIKGSQFYRLEKVVEKLMKHPEKAKDLLVRQDARWK